MENNCCSCCCCLLSLQEPGDIDYSSVAFLATVSSVMSTLVGRGGLMVELVPDASVLHYMQVGRG